MLPLICLLQGCFVFEEIDKGRALMEAHSPKELEDIKPAPRPGRQPKEEPGWFASTTETVTAWWEKASQPAAPERDPEDVPVACEIKGSAQYMRASDCRLRGGRIL